MTETLPASVWRSRDFRLVFAAGTINDIGDWMLMLALPFYVYAETGSGRDTTLVFLIELLVGITCGAFGGSLVDRWNLRRTIIATNLLQAATLLPLFVVNEDRIWIVFIVAGLQSLLQQVNNPASWALVPRVVREDQLVHAGAAFSAGGSIARLVGAPLGGILIAEGGLDVVVAVDAATFLTIAFAMLFLRTATDPVAHPLDDLSDASDNGVLAGWRAIRTRPILIGYLVAQSLAQIAFAMFSLVFIKFVIVKLDGGGTEIGLIRGCAAFGGLIASLLITRVAKRANPAYLMLWGYFSFAIVGWAFINATYFTTVLGVFLVLFALSGFPNAMSQIGANATAQRWCPPEIRGRLAGVTSATGNVGAIVGTIAAGVLIDRVSVITLFNAQTMMFFLAGVVTLLLIVRRLPQDPS